MEKYGLVLEETWLDYPSPDGNAIIIYMTGCDHNCPGCHSPLLQKIRPYDEEPEVMVSRIERYAHRADTNKLVFLGGDPLYKSNVELIKYFVDNLKDSFDICIFTGYNIDYVKSLNIKGVKYYKCGLYDQTKARQSKKTDTEYVLASSNQDFYDGNYNKLSENGILTF